MGSATKRRTFEMESQAVKWGLLAATVATAGAAIMTAF
jgi:hypothetical protein